MGTKGEAVQTTRKPPVMVDDMHTLDAYDKHLDESGGESPIAKELALRLGVTERAVVGSIQRLARTGMIGREARTHRGTWITPDGFAALEEWRNQREAIA